MTAKEESIKQAFESQQSTEAKIKEVKDAAKKMIRKAQEDAEKSAS